MPDYRASWEPESTQPIPGSEGVQDTPSKKEPPPEAVKFAKTATPVIMWGGLGTVVLVTVGVTLKILKWAIFG